MNEEKLIASLLAGATLKDHKLGYEIVLAADGGSYCVCWNGDLCDPDLRHIRGIPGEPCISLDGDFSPAELRALANHMEKVCK